MPADPPPSRHGHRFNHDDEAAGYDQDVSGERGPIRQAYGRCLAWVARQVATAPAGSVLDLGVGTGNLAALIAPDRPIVGVDLSGEMLTLAADKLADRSTQLVQQDLLAYLRGVDQPFAAVISTYALHHLEADEKDEAISHIGRCLLPGGIVSIGDLGFRDPGDRAQTIRALVEAGYERAPQVVEDELFWDFSARQPAVEQHVGPMALERFSPLSWGMVARRS